MRMPLTTHILHAEVEEILAAEELLDTSALAPLGEEGEGDCTLHDGCRPVF
jgi:hypothetical protein